MKRYQISLLIALLLISSSCSTKPTTRKIGVLTVAVVGEHVFVGEAVSFGFEGNFSMSSITSPPINCKGKFRYRTRSSKGKATYTCDNEMKGVMQIRPEGVLKGSGDGETPLGPMKALFGYNLRKVNERLSFPRNGQLIYSDREFQLVHLE